MSIVVALSQANQLVVRTIHVGKALQVSFGGVTLDEANWERKEEGGGAEGQEEGREDG